MEGTYRSRPVAWWMGPPNRRAAAAAWGAAKYAASGGSAFVLLLGLFANFTVTGSVEPFGMVPFNSCIARSASTRWSKRMNPTPFDKPGERRGRVKREIKNLITCPLLTNKHTHTYTPVVHFLIFVCWLEWNWKDWKLKDYFRFLFSCRFIAIMGRFGSGYYACHYHHCIIIDPYISLHCPSS